MKYTEILCWVDRKEKAEIKAEDNPNKIPLIFAKNYEDFKNKIKPSSLLTLSLKKARYKKVFELAGKFPNNLFCAFEKLDDAIVTPIESDFLHEIPNVNKKGSHLQHAPSELFIEFYKD
ncbi:hypothetical protein FACS189450_01950 [Spirochaetia bacterium]|nr:hypothetical protein FACS189496_1680 [Bacilli bacterium]GHU69309.1 hypothetical protein FACS189450_01950 [Spirochaetia bacterium]